MIRSLWSDTASLPAFAPLRQDLKTDVLIIGGGLAGILCAYMLQQAGVDNALVEAGSLCGGVTQNTTAKITAQHGLIYDKLIRKFGVEQAWMYWKANNDALEQYRRLCKTIDCGFEEQDSYVYSLDDRPKLEAEMAALGRLGIPAQFSDALPLPFSVVGAVKFLCQAQFHPLRFAAGLVNGLHIYEHTPVRELIGLTAVTDQGKIRASKIIVATHFPILNKHGSYFLKLYQHRSYVLALKQGPDLHGMYVDEAQKGLSFRSHGEYLLLGGGDHRTGKQGGNWAELSVFAKKYYPNLNEAYRWATQDCMSLDGVPYIGQYSRNTPGLYVAAGFNKWGMTSAMAAATILRDMVLGKQPPCAPVFSPSRTMLRPQLLLNGLESTANLLTPTRPRCPHMGCALKWNPVERSWDCPCHGSRFTKEGKLLENPATGDLKAPPS